MEHGSLSKTRRCSSKHLWHSRDLEHALQGILNRTIVAFPTNTSFYMDGEPEQGTVTDIYSATYQVKRQRENNCSDVRVFTAVVIVALPSWGTKSITIAAREVLNFVQYRHNANRGFSPPRAIHCFHSCFKLTETRSALEFLLLRSLTSSLVFCYTTVPTRDSLTYCTVNTYSTQFALSNCFAGELKRLLVK